MLEYLHFFIFRSMIFDYALDAGKLNGSLVIVYVILLVSIILFGLYLYVKKSKKKNEPPDVIQNIDLVVDNSQETFSYVKLVWNAPNDNGKKILDYSIQYKEIAADNWNEQKSTETKCKIQVTKGHTYDFRINSRNSIGSSNFTSIKKKFVTSTILDEFQQVAVSFEKKTPLMVMAGPGSGKTRVVAERVKDLILNQGVDPQKIFCMTFTKSGQKTMIERLVDDKDLAKHKKTFPKENVRTFHSLCMKYLDLSPNQVFAIQKTNDNDNNRIYTDVMNEWIEKFKKTDHDFKYYSITDDVIDEFIDAVSSFKREKLSYLDLDKYLSGKDDTDLYVEKLKDLYIYFKSYQEFLILKKMYDFDDFLSLTHDKLINDPDFKKLKQQQIEHLIIDEFQDNNYLQFAIAKEITSGTITVVGDRNQSIYSFQGANIGLFDDFKKHYNNFFQADLKFNYRSTPEIVATGKKFLQNALNEKSEYVAKRNSDCTIHIKKFDVVSDEIRFIAKLIATYINKSILLSKIQNRQINFSDFTILARTNKDRKKIHENLIKLGIPCFTKNYLRIQYKEGKFSKAFLRIMDSYSLKPASPISELIEFLKKENISEEKNQICFSLNEEKLMSDDEKIIKSSLYCLARIYFEKNPDSTLKDFNSYLEKQSHSYLENNPHLKNGVHIMTAHQSKGEEFHFVIIPFTIAEHFPLEFQDRELKVPKELSHYDNSNINEESLHLEEESRVFYVALSRAMNELIITHSMSDEDNQGLTPSPFLKHL